MPAYPQTFCERGTVTTAYELRCRECGKSYGVQPLSICDECFSPLEVKYDLDYARKYFTREAVAQGPLNMARYKALLPIPEGRELGTPAGLTPLLRAPRLGAHIGAKNLWIKNDAVCMPTLSFKDRVVAVALANAQEFGFDTVGCSSTGNLANAVAAQAARLGLKTFILVPADLEPAKILNTQVYGATLVRVEGNYDHCNRLSSQIADRYNWGFVNVNLRPYYAEGSKTVGFEIAEQLGWRLAGQRGGADGRRIADYEDPQGVQRADRAGACGGKAGAVLRRAGHRLLTHCQGGEGRDGCDRAAAAEHHRALAGDRQSGGRNLRGADDSRDGRMG